MPCLGSSLTATRLYGTEVAAFDDLLQCRLHMSIVQINENLLETRLLLKAWLCVYEAWSSMREFVDIVFCVVDNELHKAARRRAKYTDG